VPTLHRVGTPVTARNNRENTITNAPEIPKSTHMNKGGGEVLNQMGSIDIILSMGYLTTSRSRSFETKARYSQDSAKKIHPQEESAKKRISLAT